MLFLFQNVISFSLRNNRRAAQTAWLLEILGFAGGIFFYFFSSYFPCKEEICDFTHRKQTSKQTKRNAIKNLERQTKQTPKALVDSYSIKSEEL